MSRRSALWSALGLLLVALLAFVIRDASEGPGDAAVDVAEEGAPPSTNLPGLLGAGRPSPAPPVDRQESARDHRPATRIQLHGHVVDLSGEPLPGARVFLVPKNVLGRGKDADPAPPHTTTDERGAWHLETRDATGHWIGAVLEGHLPAYLDGDNVRPPAALKIVLTRGPTLRVRVRGTEGGPLALPTNIIVESMAPAFAWPGPGSTWAVARTVTIPAGSQATHFHVGTYGEVRVTARPQHGEWQADPPERTVLPATQDCVFTISRSCVLYLRVMDAETGAPLSRGFNFSVLQDGKAINGGMTWLRGGRMRMANHITPGTYTIEVRATGYASVVTKPITLTLPGEEATVQATLHLDPTRGSLRVSLPVLAHLPAVVGPRGRALPRTVWFLWRRSKALAAPFERGVSPAMQWGALDGEQRRENDTDYLFEGVPSGDVSLLVCDVASGLVAYAPRIMIRGGHTDTTTLDLQAGVHVDVTTLLTGKGDERSFRVRHPRYGELPTIHVGASSSWWEDPGVVPAREGRLGPYPGPRIEIEITDASGKIVKHTFSTPK